VREVWQWSSRWLPRGWPDALLQLGLFAGAYLIYRLVRGLTESRAAAAFEHGRVLIEAERALGLLVEPAIQSWTIERPWLVQAVNLAYINSHFVLTVGFLIWLYLARTASFNFVRNAFMVAMGLALVGYAVYPTAPPRFFPEWGFTDTIRESGLLASAGEDTVYGSDTFYNPYAAVPSVHVAFSLLVAVPAALVVRSRLARALWALYPAAVTFTVIATGHHFWLDAVFGALTAALAALAAREALARLRPEAWAWPSAPPSPARPVALPAATIAATGREALPAEASSAPDARG